MVSSSMIYTSYIACCTYSTPTSCVCSSCNLFDCDYVFIYNINAIVLFDCISHLSRANIKQKCILLFAFVVLFLLAFLCHRNDVQISVRPTQTFKSSAFFSFCSEGDFMVCNMLTFYPISM